MEASALKAPVGLRGFSLGTPLLKLRSDEQLLALFRAGNENAFGVIHDRYRQRIFAYTRQMLSRSRQDAEDAVQDVFIRAYSALRADDRPVALRAWLYRVAHNRCIDQLRRPEPPAVELFEDAGPSMPDPLAQTEQREDLRRLVADVQRLPEQQRSVLLMRELEGLPYADLAEAQGISVAAVKSLLVRARLGLVEASLARDTDCAEIRSDLALARGRGVRASGRVRRHLRDCSGCRDYKGAMRSMDKKFAALAPTVGPLGVLVKLTGLGGSGSGGIAGCGAAGGGIFGGGAAALTTTKLAIIVVGVVATAGGAAEVEHQVHQHAAQRTAPTPTVVAPEKTPARAAAPVPVRHPETVDPTLAPEYVPVPTTGDTSSSQSGEYDNQGDSGAGTDPGAATDQPTTSDSSASPPATDQPTPPASSGGGGSDTPAPPASSAATDAPSSSPPPAPSSPPANVPGA